MTQFIAKYIMIFTYILCCMPTKQIQQKQSDYLMKFERKINVSGQNLNIKTCKRKINRFHGRVISVSYTSLSENDKNLHVGTSILYNVAEHDNILKLGTWTTKTDSFLIEGTDTVIIFMNPYPKIHCYVDTVAPLEGFKAQDIVGHTFQWTSNEKLWKGAVEENNINYRVIYDTISGKIINRSIVK